MNFRSCLAALLLIGLLGMPAAAQPQSDPSVPTRLAVGHVASVVELPIYFRLYQVHLPAARHASYRGASAMLYDLAGAPKMDREGGATQPLAAGAGAFIAGGQEVTLTASPSEPADLLLFVLTHRPNQRPPFDRPAIVKELHRTGVGLPGLKTGAYEFVLERVVYPAGMPPTAPRYRTGAALYYVLAGNGSLMADGKTEPMSAGMAQTAPAGWFHQWANPGNTPLVVLQASITQEGAAAIVPEPAK